MPTGRISLIDTRTCHQRAALPTVPVLSSRQAPWTGICVEEHHSAAIDAPEVILLEPWISVVVGGEAEVQIRSKHGLERVKQSPGNIAVLGPGLVPPIIARGRTDMLYISLRPSLFSLAAQSGAGRITLRNAFAVSDPQVYFIAMALRAELESGCAGGRLYGDSLASALAVHLLQRYATDQLPLYKGGIQPRRLRQVLDYIDENLGSDLTLKELSDVAQISPFRFVRLFKQTLGLPPHQFVLRRRVQRAQRMLEASRAPLAEIARNVGFENHSHFSTVFRSLVGTTPRAYRDLQA